VVTPALGLESPAAGLRCWVVESCDWLSSPVLGLAVHRCDGLVTPTHGANVCCGRSAVVALWRERADRTRTGSKRDWARTTTLRRCRSFNVVDYQIKEDARTCPCAHGFSFAPPSSSRGSWRGGFLADPVFRVLLLRSAFPLSWCPSRNIAILSCCMHVLQSNQRLRASRVLSAAYLAIKHPHVDSS
jgi:hypothetical protein